MGLRCCGSTRSSSGERDRPMRRERHDENQNYEITEADLYFMNQQNVQPCQHNQAARADRDMMARAAENRLQSQSSNKLQRTTHSRDLLRREKMKKSIEDIERRKTELQLMTQRLDHKKQHDHQKQL